MGQRMNKFLLKKYLASCTPCDVPCHQGHGMLPINAIDVPCECVCDGHMCQRAGLMVEPIEASGHSVTDGKIALGLKDIHETIDEIPAKFSAQRHHERQLRLVEIPHRAHVEVEGAIPWPEG